MARQRTGGEGGRQYGRRGGYRPGAGRPAGAVGKRKLIGEEAALPMGQRALNVLVACMEDDEAPWPARVQAAAHVADRAFGKPRQAVDVDIHNRSTLGEQLDRAWARVDELNRARGRPRPLTIEHQEAEPCPPTTTSV